MRRLAMFAVLGLVLPGAHARPAHADPPPPVAEGLPDNVPPAALAPEPALPVPSGWPFTDAFPRTSGTGRTVAGTVQWSDFLYDDHGATGYYSQFYPGYPAGTYTYGNDGRFSNVPGADPDARMNGADIFRAAIGVDALSTYWRIDWTTLVDANIPIAAFALDVDANASTGATNWPANARVRSAGIELALVVSSRGAWMIDAVTGVRTALGPITTDAAARSFIVRVPRTTLPVVGAVPWTVRLASGLANAAGDAFANVPNFQGAQPNQPAVYNVAFRSYLQEPAATGIANQMMESAQAAALTNGDVSAFALTVRWDDLLAGDTEPEPLPTGRWLNRWYVSSIELGQGVVNDAFNNQAGWVQDLRPNFLGRVQPYGVYVPTTYDASAPVPLTWMLHSLALNHNQYEDLNPDFIRRACELRGSICATILGRGLDGWYLDEAELDFWEVWNRLASAFRLDPERTVLSGYSMGGFGTYKLGLAHPDLFAKAVVLAGPVRCGIEVVEGTGFSGGSGRCATDSAVRPMLANARSLPYLIWQNARDELVPTTGVQENVDELDRLGYRYRYELYPELGHLDAAALDIFASPAAYMAGAVRERDPGHVTYAWYPNLDRPAWGLVATGAYWVRDVAARSSAPGSIARIDAVSGMRPQPAVTPVKTFDAIAPEGGAPAVVVQNDWTYGATPASEYTMTLDLRNVSEVRVDLAGAGFPDGTGPMLTVTSDGPATIRAGATTVTVGAGVETFDLSPPPVLEAIGDRTIDEMEPVTIGVTATDRTPGSTIVLDAGPLPDGATFDDYGDGTGTFSWRPDSTRAGTYHVTFSAARDGALQARTEQIAITVRDAERRAVSSNGLEYRTVQEALDDGGTVRVLPGTHTGALEIARPGTTLCGSADGDGTACITDRNAAGPVVFGGPVTIAAPDAGVQGVTFDRYDRGVVVTAPRASVTHVRFALGNVGLELAAGVDGTLLRQSVCRLDTPVCVGSADGVGGRVVDARLNDWSVYVAAMVGRRVDAPGNAVMQNPFLTP